jgi:hypothetical protein
MRILCGILSILQNIVMDLNNIMSIDVVKKSQPITFGIGINDDEDDTTQLF